MRQILHTHNGKQGNDSRGEVVGLDLDECLREAVKNHIAASQRTRRDVAISLRIETADFEAWFNGETSASLEMVSTLAAVCGMDLIEILSYSETYRADAKQVADYSQMLAKRIALTWTEEQMSFSLAIASMLQHHPEALGPIKTGLQAAIRYAGKLGFDVDAVSDRLERVAAAVRDRSRRRG